MTKRIFDLSITFLLLPFLLPIMIFFLIITWIYDFKNPLYLSTRVGRNGKKFNLIKLRSMIVDAEKSGVMSTSKNDNRITYIGKFIRKYKIDEVFQIINVIKNDMSLVGPRPNVEIEINKYNEKEKIILKEKPGITDIASIVFADEGDILKDSGDPDRDYNLIIRPYKSRLCIVYVNENSIGLDFLILFITFINIFNRKSALFLIKKKLEKYKLEDIIIKNCSRENKKIDLIDLP